MTVLGEAVLHIKDGEHRPVTNQEVSCSRFVLRRLHSKVDVDRFSLRAFEIIEIELEASAPISAIPRS
jgi:hypothetical protein